LVALLMTVPQCRVKTSRTECFL